MNCEQLQENLFEYLDETLSPAEKAAAEKHLAGCGVCRDTVQRELLQAQTLSSRLSQAIESVALDSNAQRRIVNTVRSRSAKSRESSFSFWSRFAVPACVAAVVLIAASWIGHHRFTEGNSRSNAGVSLAPTGRVPIHFSYSIPDYFFHQEGGVVVDTLIIDTRFVDGALLARE